MNDESIEENIRYCCFCVACLAPLDKHPCNECYHEEENRPLWVLDPKWRETGEK